MAAVAARCSQMISTITSRKWPPRPTLRSVVLVHWFIGEHGFWMSGLRESQQWIAPWYGTTRDYETQQEGNAWQSLRLRHCES